jgi:hypothetical protein
MEPEIYNTRERLLDDLVQAARSVRYSAKPYDETGDYALVDMEFTNSLISAVNAWDAGPRVPPGHCSDCGGLGDQEIADMRVCGDIECGGYHTTCQEGAHREDCEWCAEGDDFSMVARELDRRKSNG